MCLEEFVIPFFMFYFSLVSSGIGWFSGKRLNAFSKTIGKLEWENESFSLFFGSLFSFSWSPG